MRSYITGSAEDLANFNAQLEHLYNRPGLVVAGSIGRAAIYSQFNWETEPLPLRTDDDPDAGLRDIDVITARRPLVEEDFGTPHLVEDGVADWFDEYSKRPSLMLSILGRGIQLFPVDAKLLSRRNRQLDGRLVRTFPVGTLLAYQQFVEADMVATGYPSLKHGAAHQEFRVFAETIRDTHPDEFHPDELYQPFRDALFSLEQNL